jgi:hypothetical protein
VVATEADAGAEDGSPAPGAHLAPATLMTADGDLPAAGEADWPELPFPEMDEPVIAFAGPAEATATVAVAVAVDGGACAGETGHASETSHANGTAHVNGAASDTLQSSDSSTTLNGLPVRRPKAQLPAKVRRNPAPAPSPTSTPAKTAPEPSAPAPSGEPGCHPEPAKNKPRIDRDPEHVAATMAAYARGLTGRNGPKSQ